MEKLGFTWLGEFSWVKRTLKSREGKILGEQISLDHRKTWPFSKIFSVSRGIPKARSGGQKGAIKWKQTKSYTKNILFKQLFTCVEENSILPIGAEMKWNFVLVGQNGLPLRILLTVQMPQIVAQELQSGKGSFGRIVSWKKEEKSWIKFLLKLPTFFGELEIFPICRNKLVSFRLKDFRQGKNLEGLTTLDKSSLFKSANKKFSRVFLPFLATSITQKWGEERRIFVADLSRRRSWGGQKIECFGKICWAVKVLFSTE